MCTMTEFETIKERLARLDERMAAFTEISERRLTRIEEKIDALNDLSPRYDSRLKSLERSYARIWTVVSGLIIGLVITVATFILQNIR